MASVGMHEAKTHLSRLVERALAGEEIVITRRGEAVVRLAPLEQRRIPFAEAFGTLPDVEIADDWDELPEDVARALGMVD
ncbi:type II toxin-antitoxin system prevent-host-death family antitoxin [Patulibacter brassicae]|uniref:Antitoxin n=1 Tax=Patulibacter brassicae TaxID=1705717 RepID=A0ABU4VI76_9ACTN|nr:type II toxin-antitoxin system prevent-host-death family antitoxin [Patulibacter brassicae]MDX8151542.1 type II toxin-antitoxin system prevent-host-death family antitoxin [Patulibacter brassicae]